MSRCSLASKPTSRGLISSRTASTACCDALAEVAALVAVTALGRLEGAGRGSRRNRGPGERAVVEPHLDLDGGVAARVQDLAGANLLNGGHSSLLGGSCSSAVRMRRRDGSVPRAVRPERSPWLLPPGRATRHTSAGVRRQMHRARRDSVAQSS